MVRPDHILAAAGGAIMRKYGVPVLGPGLRSRTAEWTMAGGGGNGRVWTPQRQNLAVESNGLTLIPTDIAYDGVFDSAALLLEPAGTNYLLQSCTFQNASWLDLNGGGTEAVVASALVGQNALKWTGQSASNSGIYQNGYTTLTNSREVISLLVENVDATATTFGLYDATAGGFAMLCTYNWTTETASLGSTPQGTNTGTLNFSKGKGPNGGDMIRITLLGIPDNNGNSARFYIYPTSTTANTESVILHHAQHEKAALPSSEIVTTTGSVTRSAQTLTIPFYQKPGPLTFYLRGYMAGYPPLMTGANNFAAIGSGSATLELDAYYSGGLAGRVYYAANGSTAQSGIPTADAPGTGSGFEMNALLDADGAVLLEYRTDSRSQWESAVKTGTKSSGLEFPTAWGADRILLGSGPIGVILAAVASGNHGLDSMSKIA